MTYLNSHDLRKLKRNLRLLEKVRVGDLLVSSEQTRNDYRGICDAVFVVAVNKVHQRFDVHLDCTCRSSTGEHELCESCLYMSILKSDVEVLGKQSVLLVEAHNVAILPASSLHYFEIVK